jgi:dienelactone hydrolase
LPPLNARRVMPGVLPLRLPTEEEAACYHLMPVSAAPQAAPTSAGPQERLNIVANKMPDEPTMQDIQAGLDYLKPQPFVKRKPIGSEVMFCR